MVKYRGFPTGLSFPAPVVWPIFPPADDRKEFWYTDILLKVLTSPVATGGFGGLSPPNKAPRASNWIMKHYKSMEFLSNFQCQTPLHERNPPLKTFWRQFCYSRVFSYLCRSRLGLITVALRTRRSWAWRRCVWTTLTVAQTRLAGTSSFLARHSRTWRRCAARQ